MYPSSRSYLFRFIIDHVLVDFFPVFVKIYLDYFYKSFSKAQSVYSSLECCVCNKRFSYKIKQMALFAIYRCYVKPITDFDNYYEKSLDRRIYIQELTTKLQKYRKFRLRSYESERKNINRSFLLFAYKIYYFRE